MARINKIFFVFATFLMVFNLIGCSSKNTENNDDLTTTSNMKLIYEETISPNKEFVEKEDIVNYTVEVYQDKDNAILVNSKSNSEFFKPLQYELELDTSITKEDIDIEWTTLMGNPISTKDDQLGIAYVSISENGELVSKRKISFINGAIEIIEDTLNNRFGCTSISDQGTSAKYDFMIDIDESNFWTDDFKSLLGFINTSEDVQTKGKYGTDK